MFLFSSQLVGNVLWTRYYSLDLFKQGTFQIHTDAHSEHYDMRVVSKTPVPRLLSLSLKQYVCIVDV